MSLGGGAEGEPRQGPFGLQDHKAWYLAPSGPQSLPGPAGTAPPNHGQMESVVEAGGQSAQVPLFQADFVTQILWTSLATVLRVASTASSMAFCPMAPWKTASTSR